MLQSFTQICLVLYPEVKELGVRRIDRFAVLYDVAAKDFVIAWRVSVAHDGIPPFYIPLMQQSLPVKQL